MDMKTKSHPAECGKGLLDKPAPYGSCNNPVKTIPPKADNDDLPLTICLPVSRNI